jgi:hypothetical protein
MAASRRTATRVTRGAISLEQLKPLSADAVFKDCKAGGIAARPRQARDEAGPDRIRGLREHDRYRAGRLQQRRHNRAARGQDYVRRERDQFCRVLTNALGIACGPAVLDPHVAADSPAPFLQPLQKRADAGLSFRIVRGQMHKHADAPHPAGLRPHRERPRSRRAAEQRDELAAPHSITSAVRALLHRTKFLHTAPKADLRGVEGAL